MVTGGLGDSRPGHGANCQGRQKMTHVVALMAPHTIVSLPSSLQLLPHLLMLRRPVCALPPPSPLPPLL